MGRLCLVSLPPCYSIRDDRGSPITRYPPQGNQASKRQRWRKGLVSAARTCGFFFAHEVLWLEMTMPYEGRVSRKEHEEEEEEEEEEEDTVRAVHRLALTKRPIVGEQHGGVGRRANPGHGGLGP